MIEDLDEYNYEVEFMNLIVDKADNLRVVDSDEHFSEFAAVSQAKIKEGTLFLHDLIQPAYREVIMKTLCRKNTPYVYFDAEFLDRKGKEVFIHCCGQNYEGSTLCRLTLVDVSKSREIQQALKKQAKEMDYLIDLVNGGVCLFKVTSDMHIVVQYLNEGGCRLFGTAKNICNKQQYRLDDLIHPQDISGVFQAIGRSMATNEPIDIEFRTVVHKNEYLWCKMNAAIIEYDNDNCPLFHAMLTDITSVKESEQNSDKMYDRLVMMFKNLPSPTFTADLENPLQLQLVSEDFIKFLGYSRSYLFDEHGGRISDFMLDREVKYVTSNIAKQAREKGEVKIRYSVRNRRGIYLLVEDNRKLIKQEDGSVSMLCAYKNLTSTYEDV